MPPSGLILGISSRLADGSGGFPTHTEMLLQDSVWSLRSIEMRAVQTPVRGIQSALKQQVSEIPFDTSDL